MAAASCSMLPFYSLVHSKEDLDQVGHDGSRPRMWLTRVLSQLTRTPLQRSSAASFVRKKCTANLNFTPGKLDSPCRGLWKRGRVDDGRYRAINCSHVFGNSIAVEHKGRSAYLLLDRELYEVCCGVAGHQHRFSRAPPLVSRSLCALSSRAQVFHRLHNRFGLRFRHRDLPRSDI